MKFNSSAFVRLLSGACSGILLTVVCYFLVRVIQFTFLDQVRQTKTISFPLDIQDSNFIQSGSAKVDLAASSSSLAYRYDLTPTANFTGFYFHLDTSLGLYNGMTSENFDWLFALSGQACAVSLSDPASPQALGLQAALCTLPGGPSSGTYTCESSCAIPRASLREGLFDSELNGSLRLNDQVRLAPRFETAEFYRVKNALGFGYTRTSQDVLGATLEPSGPRLAVRASCDKASNASWWQPAVVWLTLAYLGMHLVLRFLALPTIAAGIQLRRSRFSIYCDLAGGLLTSPGASTVSAALVLVVLLPEAVWIEAALDYSTDWYDEFLLVAAVAALLAMLLQQAFVGTTFKLYSSGTLLMLFSAAARAYTRAATRVKLQAYVRSLGMALIDQHVLLVEDSGGVRQQIVETNVADGVGVSGLEVLVTGYTDQVLLTAAIVLAFELLVAAAHWALRSRSTASQLSSLSHASSGVRTGSSYVSSLLVCGASHSHFCKAWTAPLDTPFGKFHTLSSMIEDSHVLWGPLLVSLTTYPLALVLWLLLGRRRAILLLVHWKFYTAVMDADYHVVPRVQVTSPPEYVEEYLTKLDQRERENTGSLKTTSVLHQSTVASTSGSVVSTSKRLPKLMPSRELVNSMPLL